jgi:hypothetical protein
VTVQANLGGVSSAPFAVTLDWPSTAGVAVGPNFTQFIDQDISTGGLTGYRSGNLLMLVSACGQAMGGISFHEEFPSGFGACNPKADYHWLTTVEGPPGITVSDPAAFGVFVDWIGMACSAGQCDPAPQTHQTPLGTTAESFAVQLWYAGSGDTQTLGEGFPAFPNILVFYQDHGRDELFTWKCPAQ